MISPHLEKNVHEQTASTTLQKPILKEIRLRPKKLDLSGASLKVSFYYQKLWFLLLRTQFGQRRLKIDQIIFGSHLEKPWLVSLNVRVWLLLDFRLGSGRPCSRPHEAGAGSGSISQAQKQSRQGLGKGAQPESSAVDVRGPIHLKSLNRIKWEVAIYIWAICQTSLKIRSH